jgi:hypothetical protein
VYLDHELFYNNVVGSLIKVIMVEEILLMQRWQKIKFIDSMNNVTNSPVTTH